MDERTPNLSLWVGGDERGRGVGRFLLRLHKSEARRRGMPALRLSVGAGNFVEHLYESEGFVHVAGRESGGVMICALKSS